MPGLHSENNLQLVPIQVPMSHEYPDGLCEKCNQGYDNETKQECYQCSKVHCYICASELYSECDGCKRLFCVDCIDEFEQKSNDSSGRFCKICFR